MTDLYIACPGQAVRNTWNPHYCITLGNGFINRCGQRDRKKTGKQDRNGKRIGRGDRRIPEGDSLVEVEETPVCLQIKKKVLLFQPAFKNPHLIYQILVDFLHKQTG